MLNKKVLIKKLFFIFIIKLLFSSPLFFYFLLPEDKVALPSACHYQTEYETKTESIIFKTQSSYTFIKTSNTKGQIIIEGQIEESKKTYHINRIIYFDILDKIGDNFYLFKAENIVIKSNDDTPENTFALSHSGLTSSVLIKVEKVNENAYLFTTQLRPLALCVVI